jgi:hypothetical protein
MIDEGNYVLNENANLYYAKGLYLTYEMVLTAVKKSVEFWSGDAKPHPYSPYLHIPSRNLSGGVGDAFGKILADYTYYLHANEHQDGYPDILPYNDDSYSWIVNPTKDHFYGGGFDMKATEIKGRLNPNASSHHRKTTSIMNTLWKINEEGICQIIGIAFANNLCEDDWAIPTKIKEGGGKTTPNCCLRTSGKQKLRNNWVLLHKKSLIEHKLTKAEEWFGLNL